jgi:biopolymer transport protein ExbB
MNTKILTIAFAIVLSLGVASSHAYAADAAAPAAPAADAAAPAAPAADATAAPAADATATATPGQPTAAEIAAAAAGTTQQVENPYGLGRLWGQGDFVARTVIVILAIMSAGTWYIFVMKYLEQTRVLNQAKVAERRFWTAANLGDGIEKLGKNSVFRSVAERAQQAMARSGGVSAGMSQAEWLGMSMQRTVDEENSRLASGIAFLASVGSTAPFVGLFGTVWGILNALIAIGVAGQASIDKVAGPVGEALIMTALGLAVAVPAVLIYNLLVRRNKILGEKLRAFSTDLQTYMLSAK